MTAKYDIDPDEFYFDATLDATAIAVLHADVNGKNRLESEKNWNLISTFVLEMKRKQSLRPVNRLFELKRSNTQEFWISYRMFSNESETLHTSEDCFTEENRELSKHLQNFMQN